MSTINGNKFENNLEGTSENDLIFAYAGNDIASGSDGNDLIVGGNGNDELNGDWGNDYLLGHSGNDTLNGGFSRDHLEGGAGNDQLNGGPSDDALFGDDGNDRLLGSTGDDFLVGDAGDDLLNGYGGGFDEDDHLRGGTGADKFILGDTSGVFYQEEGSATISDFDFTEGDQIQVFGNASDYSLENFGEGVAIYYQNDLIAHITNTNDVVLKDDFIFV